MSSRLTRKDIKRDEVLETIGGFVSVVTRYAKTIAAGALALLVLALAFVAYRALASRKAEAASGELAHALRAYGAPVVAEGANPSDIDAPSFADKGSRATRARELFTQLREEFGGTDAADIAGAYLGSLASADGDLEGAREHWERFLDRQSGHVLASEIRLNLMSLDRALGRGAELVEELRDELTAAQRDLPEEVLLDQLAKTLESLDRTDEALDIYERLVQDFPQSAFARTASERVAALGPDSGI